MGYFILKFRKFLFFVFLSNLGFTNTVVCTTSIISSVIKDISEGKIKVRTIVPPGICPGHVDIKVNDLKLIEKNGFLFAHGFEPYLEKIKNNIRNPKFKIILIETKGNSLIPENQILIYNRIGGKLVEIYPEYREFILKNLEKKIEQIKKVDDEIKKMVMVKRLKGKKVICNNHIKDLVEYFGFEVVDVYGRKEDLTPLKIKELIGKIKIEGIDLVIDNLQSGKDTGKIFTNEFKIPHVVISNFPLALPNTETMRETLYKNFLIIINTLEKWKKLN